MRLALLALLSCSLGCAATRADVHLPGDRDGGGTVSLLFSRQVDGALVAIDGVLVADGVRARRLVVHDVPSGYVDVAFAAGGVDRQLRVFVAPGRDTAVPVSVGPPAGPNPILGAVLSVGALLISRGLGDWLF